MGNVFTDLIISRATGGGEDCVDDARQFHDNSAGCLDPAKFQTPEHQLCHTVEVGTMETIKMFLQKNPLLNLNELAARRRKSRSIFNVERDYAWENDERDYDCILVESVLQNALHCACRLNRADVVELLLSKGADPNISDMLMLRASYKAAQGKHHIMHTTPLMQASSPAVAKLLLDGKANVTAVDNRGNGVVHHAVMRNKLCIGHTYVDSRDKGNMHTFLSRRTNPEKEASRLELVKLLLQAKATATMNARNRGGENALSLTLKHASHAYLPQEKYVARSLLICGASIARWHEDSPLAPYLTITQHFTPLHWAAAARRKDLCLKYLRKNGDPFAGEEIHQTYPRGKLLVTPINLACNPLMFVPTLYREDQALAAVGDSTCAIVHHAATCLWSPCTAYLFPEKFRRRVYFLLWANRQPSGRTGATCRLRLPRVNLFQIIHFLQRDDVGPGW